MFAGPFLNLDVHSKWAKVVKVKHTTIAKTIAALRHLFATHGIPEQIMSDNRPQFTSYDFEEFMRKMYSNIRDYHIIIQAQTVKQNGLSGHSRRSLKQLRMMALP